MKKNIFLILITLCSLNCGKPCIESRGIEGAGLTITFFHIANNEYFYPVNTSISPFNIDSLRVKDSQGHCPFLTSGTCARYINLEMLDTRNGHRNEKICAVPIT